MCLITGPAGTGKSSSAKALAQKFDRTVVISEDSLRRMIISGLVKPWPWNAEAKLQVELGAENACSLANNFLAKGFNVIIDSVIGQNLLEYYKRALKEHQLKVILLLPSKEALLKRFDECGNDTELRKRTKELHDIFLSVKDELDWEVIDSSNQSLDETVNEIVSKIHKE